MGGLLVVFCSVFHPEVLLLRVRLFAVIVRTSVFHLLSIPLVGILVVWFFELVVRIVFIVIILGCSCRVLFFRVAYRFFVIIEIIYQHLSESAYFLISRDAQV